MLWRPPESKRTDAIFPYTTFFPSELMQVNGGTPFGGPGRNRVVANGAASAGTRFKVLACSSDPTSAKISFLPKTSYQRSEEHTSELQSLMRTSYAVFCLTKKKYTIIPTYQHEHNRTIKTLLS